MCAESPHSLSVLLKLPSPKIFSIALLCFPLLFHMIVSKLSLIHAEEAQACVCEVDFSISQG